MARGGPGLRLTVFQAPLDPWMGAPVPTDLGRGLRDCRPGRGPRDWPSAILARTHTAPLTLRVHRLLPVCWPGPQHAPTLLLSAYVPAAILPSAGSQVCRESLSWIHRP